MTHDELIAHLMTEEPEGHGMLEYPGTLAETIHEGSHDPSSGWGGWGRTGDHTHE